MPKLRSVAIGAGAAGVFAAGAWFNQEALTPPPPPRYERVLNSDMQEVARSRGLDIGNLILARTSIEPIPTSIIGLPDYSRVEDFQAEAYNAAGSQDGLPVTTQNHAAQLCLTAVLSGNRLGDNVAASWLRHDYIQTADDCTAILQRDERNAITIVVPVGLKPTQP